MPHLAHGHTVSDDAFRLVQSPTKTLTALGIKVKSDPTRADNQIGDAGVVRATPASPPSGRLRSLPDGRHIFTEWGRT